MPTAILGSRHYAAQVATDFQQSPVQSAIRCRCGFTTLFTRGVLERTTLFGLHMITMTQTPEDDNDDDGAFDYVADYRTAIGVHRRSGRWNVFRRPSIRSQG